MIRRLKPYPASKDSGGPFLGKIPHDRRVRRQRNVQQMFVSTIDKHSVEAQLPVRADLHKIFPCRQTAAPRKLPGRARC